MEKNISICKEIKNTPNFQRKILAIKNILENSGNDTSRSVINKSTISNSIEKILESDKRLPSTRKMPSLNLISNLQIEPEKKEV
jgi:hypothetical protein